MPMLIVVLNLNFETIYIRNVYYIYLDVSLTSLLYLYYIVAYE